MLKYWNQLTLVHRSIPTLSPFSTIYEYTFPDIILSNNHLHKMANF